MRLLLAPVILIMSMTGSRIQLLAHPGIGIVCDKRGNIYYTDLSKVWKITNDGSRHVVVSGVHTHELCLDTAGNLYGEHLWYEGEMTDRWGHFVWRLTPGGIYEIIRDSTEGFLKDYSFVRDNAGNMYGVERGDTCYFIKHTPGGERSIIARGVLAQASWLFCSSGRQLYFTNEGALYRVRGQTIVKLTGNLRRKAPLFSSMADDHHNLMGIWEDAQGNIYVASYGGQVVRKVNPANEVSDFVKSTGRWSPTGGVFDPDGNLWLMEVSLVNEVRVRKIEVSKSGDLRKNGFPQLFIQLKIALGVIILVLVYRWFSEKRKPA